MYIIPYFLVSCADSPLPKKQNRITVMPNKRPPIPPKPGGTDKLRAMTETSEKHPLDWALRDIINIAFKLENVGMTDYAQRLHEVHTAIQTYVIAKDLELDSWRDAASE